MMLQLDNCNDNVAELLNTIHSYRLFVDLDGVCIDATHRQILKPDGSLDLAKYRENSTAAKIRKDKPLPFLQGLQWAVNRDHFHGVSICTARVMCTYTRRWLDKRGALPSDIISRQGDRDIRRDHVLKHAGITERVTTKAKLRRSVLIDDNMNNIEMAHELGMLAIHVPFEGH